MTNSTTIEQKINYIKEKNLLFKRPLLIITPIFDNTPSTINEYLYPELDQCKFEFDLMNIEFEFKEFESLYNKVFLEPQMILTSLELFKQYFKYTLGFSKGYDDESSFHWSNLVSYPFDIGEGYDNYFFYYRHYISENQDCGHIIKGFDKKVESAVIESYELLLSKFEKFFNLMEKQIFISDPNFDYNNKELTAETKDQKANSKIIETNKIVDPETTEEYEKDLAMIINVFYTMHREKWEYAFREEKDVKMISELIAKYYNGINYELPKYQILNTPKCKTILSAALRTIYLKRRNIEIKLKDDNQFIEIVKMFQIYKDLTDFEVYKLVDRQNL